jgi:hypothetical protein
MRQPNWDGISGCPEPEGFFDPSPLSQRKLLAHRSPIDRTGLAAKDDPVATVSPLQGVCL